jgi:predicted anti-sigma-YlaC factor YlaD
MAFKPTCKEIHRLTSEGMDRPLSTIERFRMRLHLMVCDACRSFGKQMALIRRAMRQAPFAEKPDPERGPE